MSYVSPFVLQDLPWYEHDDLMTCTTKKSVKTFGEILTDTSMKQTLLTLISSRNSVMER